MKKFNCFNPYMSSNWFLSVVDRHKYLFYLKEKNSLSLFYYKNGSPSINANYKFKQKRVLIYLNQLFYSFFINQRFYQRLIFGLLPRYLRFVRVLSAHNLNISLKKVLLKFRKLGFLLLNLKLAFLKTHDVSQIKSTLGRAGYLKTIKLLLFHSFAVFKQNLFFEGRFCFFNTHFKQLSAGVRQFQNDYQFFDFVRCNFYCSRRRLFYFSGQLFMLVLTSIALYSSLYKYNGLILLFIYLFILNKGYWSCYSLKGITDVYFCFRHLYVLFLKRRNVLPLFNLLRRKHGLKFLEEMQISSLVSL
jgi:hypothetical protein